VSEALRDAVPDGAYAGDLLVASVVEDGVRPGAHQFLLAAPTEWPAPAGHQL